MARYKDETETTGQALRDFAETLRQIATILERHADFMAESNLETVLTTHWKTARDCAEGLATFAGAVQNATIRARMVANLERMTPKQGPEREGEAANTKKPGRKKSP